MSRDLNLAFEIGRLTTDVSIRYTGNGMPVANFSIANNEKRKDSDYVNYFDITAWDKVALLCEQYLKKGSKIAVEGNLRQERWQDKNGQTKCKVIIVANKIQFLDTKEKTEALNEQPADPWQEGMPENTNNEWR